MNPDELLDRIADTLRTDIAPAVGEDYQRTQTHMAAVVLRKLSAQLALGPAHAEAEAADVVALVDALEPVLADAPTDVVGAWRELRAAGTVAAAGPLVAELHRWSALAVEAGEPQALDPASAALALIRPVLRRDIDRRMEIAR